MKLNHTSLILIKDSSWLVAYYSYIIKSKVHIYEKFVILVARASLLIKTNIKWGCMAKK